MRPVLVLADQVLHRDRVNVARLIRLLDSGKSNVQLGRLALGAASNHSLPVIVVELVAGGVARNGVTNRVVVELDEQLVKGRLLDHVLHDEVLRISRALRSTGYQHGGVERAERLNHLDVRPVGYCMVSLLNQ